MRQVKLLDRRASPQSGFVDLAQVDSPLGIADSFDLPEEQASEEAAAVGNPFLDVTGDEVTLIEAGSGGGQRFQSGQLTSTVTTTSPFGIEADTLSAWVFVNVFTTAVPEPSAWASMLLGLFLLGSATARGRRARPCLPDRRR